MTTTRLSYIPQPHEQVSFDFLKILQPRGVEMDDVSPMARCHALVTLSVGQFFDAMKGKIETKVYS